MNFREELAKELGLGKIAEETILNNYVDACEKIAKKYHTEQLRIGGVRRSIYEYFTDAEIGLFQHLVKEYSKSEKWDDYKQKKLDKLQGKLKQLRSF